MTDTIFVSFEREDQARAATIIGALHDAGYQVDGDAPDGDDAAGRAATEAALARAWIVLVLWSEAAIGRSGDRRVAAQARSAAERGAYLGVTIDKVAPPFGFTGFQLVDLSKWSGGRDGRLAALVEEVRKRMDRLPSGPAPSEEQAARRMRPLYAIVAVLAVVLAAAIYWMSLVDPTDDRAAQIDAELAAIPCAWLQVDPVDNGSAGRLALTGVADDPERGGETIRGLVRNDPGRTEVTIDRVARIGSAGCPAIDVSRRLRRDDGGRMRILSDGVVVNPGMGLAEARVALAFRGGDKAMALFGIEPSGAVTTVLPDRDSLKLLANEDVGYVEPKANAHEFSLRSDHTGWTGLILLTGSTPFAGRLTQGEVDSPADFAGIVERGTSAGGWASEMVWYKIEPR
jgi:type II secretory pathway component PulM